VSSSFDAVENRARHAAKGLNMMANTLQIPPVSRDSDGRSRRAAVSLLVAAAAVTLIAVVTAVAMRGGSTQRGNIPAFDPTPLPGGQRVSTAFQPAASYELPSTHQLVIDQPNQTLVDLGEKFPLGSGQLVVFSVGAWYAGAQVDGPSTLPDVVAADPRLRLLQRQVTSVGGDLATRLVVQILPRQGDDDWFCTDASQTLCTGMGHQGRETLYLVRHGQATVLISGGAGNDRLGAAVGRVVDSVAATWQWTER
jgi:hypothetical protein